MGLWAGALQDVVRAWVLNTFPLVDPAHPLWLSSTGSRGRDPCRWPGTSGGLTQLWTGGGCSLICCGGGPGSPHACNLQAEP